MRPGDILLKKLRIHSKLSGDEMAAIRKLPCQFRELSPDEDVIRQGDRPKAAAVVIEGMVARYHTLRSGRRQYLTLHIAGDWPDAQGLFLEEMDHSVCAVGEAFVCYLLHKDLKAVFDRRPSVAFAIWRETLVDAAIFREAITNNSSRAGTARLAHLFCEVYARAHSVGLVDRGSVSLPLTQTQIGEFLGMSLITVNRHLQALRRSGAADFRSGRLTVKNWDRLVKLGDFDAAYLHRKLMVV